MEVILTLLSAGAEVDHADNERWTALDVAAQWGHVETIHALLAAGAEVNHADNLGWTALRVAAQKGHVEAIDAPGGGGGGGPCEQRRGDCADLSSTRWSRGGHTGDGDCRCRPPPC